MRVLELYWSRALSLVCEVALSCHGSTEEDHILTMVINACTLPPYPWLPDWHRTVEICGWVTFSPGLQPWTVGCQQKEWKWEKVEGRQAWGTFLMCHFRPCSFSYCFLIVVCITCRLKASRAARKKQFMKFFRQMFICFFTHLGT